MQEEAKVKKESATTEIYRDNLIAKERQKQQANGGAAAGTTTETVMVTSSAVAPSWRVGKHGLIQRFGENRKWMKQQSGVTADLYSFSATGPDIVWVVGQSGTILRTVDGGASWTKVPSPTDEDITHVEATSDQAARVVTRSGKTFVTTDAGSSWNPQQ